MNQVSEATAFRFELEAKLDEVISFIENHELIQKINKRETFDKSEMVTYIMISTVYEEIKQARRNTRGIN